MLRSQLAVASKPTPEHTRTSLIEWQLAGNTQVVTNLRLASSELAEHFRDRTSLKATIEEIIELFASSCDLNYILAHLMHVRSTLEVHGNHLGRFRQKKKKQNKQTNKQTLAPWNHAQMTVLALALLGGKNLNANRLFL
jgi:hypothetical protein